MALNIENLTKLINHLKKVNQRNVYMGTWLEAKGSRFRNKRASDLVSYMETNAGDCGTVACIAGHAALLAQAERGEKIRDQDSEDWFSDDSYDPERDAMAWLGLEGEQKYKLFLPSYMADRTKEDIIEVLENLRETALKGDPKIEWKDMSKDNEY